MIRYYIPADGDDPAHPNIFHVPNNASQLTLRDVRQNFPLPGTYHFRFKKKLGEGRVVWMDLTEDAEGVPTFDGVVLAKVSRLSMDVPKATAAGNNGPSARAGVGINRTSEQSNAAPTISREDSTTADLLNMGTPSPTRSSHPPPSRPKAPDADPFGLFESAPPVNPAPVQQVRPPAPPGGPASGAPPDLLNFDAFGTGRAAGPPRGPPRGPPMQPPVGRGGYPGNPGAPWPQF